MNKTFIAALITALAATISMPAAAEGPGSCGKGKVWDADKSKCVPKPRGSGSSSGSHH